MKLALIVTGGLHPSGREQVMPAWLTLIERLSRTHDVHAFVLRHLPQETTYSLAGATVHDLGRPTGRWAQWRALSQALRSAGPFDVIHGFWADPAGVLTALAGKRLRVPTVVTCDSGEFTALPEIEYGLQRHARGRAVVATTCRLASRIHVTTQFMERLVAEHGYTPTRIPIGVDTDAIAREAERVEGPPWRLLQVASLNRVKDHSTLLQAVAVARRTVDVQLDLIGEDTLEGRIQSEAAALGLTSAVTFHGFVPYDELHAFRARAHLYVQSSRHEAAGAAVMEAAAAGLPIVGTRVGFVSDWAPAGAIAVSPGDADALAAAIVHALQHPEERAAVATVAHEFAHTHDVNYTARALETLYGQLTRGRR